MGAGCLLRKMWGIPILAIAIWLGSCKTEEKFPKLGDKITGAADIASSSAGRYFYVLNSDYERRYNQGSLLIIDPEAAEGSQKLRTIATRRLGRTLSVGQGKLLITYDSPTEPSIGYVELWSLADEAQPVLSQTLDIDCSPIDAIIAPSQPYFAVACGDGGLFMGTLGLDGGSATLDKVRAYGHEHRAMYFYEGAKKTYLLAFPSDSDLPEHDDFQGVDRQTYVPNKDATAEGAMVDGQNEVPDIFEESASARRRLGSTLPYRMIVYSVTDELASSQAEAGDYAKFRFIELGTPSKPTKANSELIYVYFNTPDINPPPGTVDPFIRNYRTNFWDVKRAVEGNGEVFYLSQRGNQYGSPSNQILRFVVDENSLLKVTEEVIRFEQIFQVTRAYGFTINRDNSGVFPSDFEIATIDNKPMLLINSFRDLVNFASAPFYSITRAFLSPPLSSEAPSSAESTDYKSSYFQVAVSASGKLLTSSFYGNALYLFDVRPDVSVSSQNPIRID